MEQVVIKEVSDRLVQFRYKQMGGEVGSGMRKKAEELERATHIGRIRESSF